MAHNKHHRFYPRSLYRRAGGIAWKFYNLPCNVLVTPITLHDAYHACHEPKRVMPSFKFMTQWVRLYEAGECGCVHHGPPSVVLCFECHKPRSADNNCLTCQNQRGGEDAQTA